MEGVPMRQRFLLIKIANFKRMSKLNIKWKIKLTGDIWLIMTKFKIILSNFSKHLVG